MPELSSLLYPQDLHIHTVYSDRDSSVVPEQTLELVARIAHARVIGKVSTICFVNIPINAVKKEAVNNSFDPLIRA